MKRSIISIMMAAALMAPVFAAGQKDAGKTATTGNGTVEYPAMVLKLGHIADPSHPYAKGADKWAELVKAKTGGKPVLLKGAMFTAKFEVQSPAQQPTPTGPVPDGSPQYSGQGQFVTTNVKVSAT